MSLSQAAPGIFASNEQAIAINPDGSLAGLAGSILATALGAVSPSIGDYVASSDTIRNTILTPRVLVGGVEAQVLFSGLSPQFAGVNQLNVIVPRVPSGVMPLQISVNGNRLFFFCLLEATSELYPEDEIGPVAECNNQPDPDDGARATREQKRPDFQWVYRDRYESRARHSMKQFVVECKRLGAAARADWVFNTNYVDHGIVRFKAVEWAYAKRFHPGAMVGYWQNMEALDVLAEVNEETLRNSLPELALVDGWNAGGVSRCEHRFERPFEVSPFTLHHLWLDLRST